MRQIFIIGGGLSSSTLIDYLLQNSIEFNWKVRVGDLDLTTIESKIGGHANGEAFLFDIFDDDQRNKEIAAADIVVSMLPARFHHLVAKSCLEHEKSMVTASYVSDEVRAMNDEVKAKGLLFLNEIGVDPGIDHMSAMSVIDQIKESGGELTSFRSYTGGLVAPRYDNNPWNYKFTWNPRNVVVAGQGTAQIIVNGRYKYIPYHQLFTRLARIDINEYGEFEAYPNRDSLKYRNTYKLENIPTMVRGTLRRPGFARSWNVFVQLGITEDTYTLEDSENMTYRDFTNTFLQYQDGITVEEKLKRYLDISDDSDIMYKLRWLGLFERKKIGLKNATPAQVLQHLLEEKWNFEEHDRDMIAMQHIFDYKMGESSRRVVSSLVVEGKEKPHTAMSITVGVPVAIAVKMILNGKIKSTGVQIPIEKDIYTPILAELKDYGIRFEEERVEFR